MIQEIIKTLDAISVNKDNEPLCVLGGYIVGATVVRDDIDELYEQYPGLEMIAELGSDLETLENDRYAKPVFEQFQYALHHFKDSLSTR